MLKAGNLEQSINVSNLQTVTPNYKQLTTEQIVDIIAVLEDILGNPRYTDQKAAKVIWDVFYPTSYGVSYSPTQLMQIIQHKPYMDKDSQDNSPLIMSITRGFVLCFAIMFKAGGGASQFNTSSLTHSIDIIHDTLYQQHAFKDKDPKGRRLCDFNESLIDELVAAAPAVFLEMHIKNLTISAGVAKTKSLESTPMSSPSIGSHRFKRNISGIKINHMSPTDYLTPNNSTPSSPVYMSSNSFAQFDCGMGELFLDQMQQQDIDQVFTINDQGVFSSKFISEKSELFATAAEVVKFSKNLDTFVTHSRPANIINMAPESKKFGLAAYENESNLMKDSNYTKTRNDDNDRSSPTLSV